MSIENWNEKQIILFDLDGTLTDPGVGITNSVMYALKKFGITVDDRKELYAFIGPPLSESFERFYGFDSYQAKEAVEIYREYFSEKGIFENSLIEGVDELLKFLKSQGKKIALATSKPEVYASRILEHFQIEEYFDVVAGSLLSGERTDKSEVICWALKQMREKYNFQNSEEKTVMVGDREHDVAGAHKNHIPCIGVLFGYGSGEELKNAGADGIVSDITQLFSELVGTQEV